MNITIGLASLPLKKTFWKLTHPVKLSSSSVRYTRNKENILTLETPFRRSKFESWIQVLHTVVNSTLSVIFLWNLRASSLVQTSISSNSWVILHTWGASKTGSTLLSTHTWRQSTRRHRTGIWLLTHNLRTPNTLPTVAPSLSRSIHRLILWPRSTSLRNLTRMISHSTTLKWLNWAICQWTPNILTHLDSLDASTHLTLWLIVSSRFQVSKWKGTCAWLVSSTKCSAARIWKTQLEWRTRGKTWRSTRGGTKSSTELPKARLQSMLMAPYVSNDTSLLWKLSWG